jgi:hypothetical protein
VFSEGELARMSRRASPRISRCIVLNAALMLVFVCAMKRWRRSGARLSQYWSAKRYGVGCGSWQQSTADQSRANGGQLLHLAVLNREIDWLKAKDRRAIPLQPWP